MKMVTIFLLYLFYSLDGGKTGVVTFLMENIYVKNMLYMYLFYLSMSQL